MGQGGTMDSQFVSSVQWWLQGRGPGDYDYARRQETLTLMKAALYATEMQLTFKIILDIVR